MIDEFKVRFLKAQVKVQDWLGVAQEDESHESSDRLPVTLTTQLDAKIASLLSPQAHKAVVQSALAKAVAQWYENPEAPNSLVVLASPIESLSLLLNETPANWEERNLMRVQSLSWLSRPHDCADIDAQLRKELTPGKTSEPARAEIPVPEKISLNMQRESIVIPRLEWCFLRCIDGLDAIEYMQEQVYRDPSRFWLIGCNNWAWQYLNYVCNAGAYFGETVTLPTLNKAELQEWLEPVLAEIDGDRGQDKGDEKSKEQWFDQLTDISRGISRVAAQLWLRSLQYESPKSDKDRGEEAVAARVKQEKPKLPDLPNLLPEDLYLLYSLLLHGGMSLSHLALSLGESETTVRSRVQFLWHADVVERHRNWLWVNPAHYPRIRATLDSNNFLVGEETEVWLAQT